MARSSGCRNGAGARPTHSPERADRLRLFEAGRGLRLDPTGALPRSTAAFTEFGSVRADGDRVVRAGAADHPECRARPWSGGYSVLKIDRLLDRRTPHRRYLTRVESVQFPTTDGDTAFGLFYPPHNPDYAPAAAENPPLLVKCHGGPTSAASSTLNLGIQYWTSRGIAVLDELRRQHRLGATTATACT
jgi:dipeptidyl aminopeptidase/acylaminoacyl peptidase